MCSLPAPLTVEKYTYLLINLATIAFPLARSFEGRVRFVARWPALLVGIGVAGAVFVVWDAWFTLVGVWQFNPLYITGLHIGPLPVEEWLFFLTVPFACMFIHDCVAYFLPRLGQRGAWPMALSLALAAAWAAVGAANAQRLYTVVTFLGAAGWGVVYALAVPRQAQARFWVAFAFSLVPFFAVNGLLTGLPVLIYNDAENLGLRLGTIPVEDAVYGLLLLQLTHAVYVWLATRWAYAWPAKATNT